MMFTNSPLNDWPSAMASILKHVVGFGGACPGARAEAVVDKRAARQSLVKEDMEEDYLLTNV